MSLLGGCMSFHSDIEGTYAEKPSKTIDTPKATVFFHFSHLEQFKGLDVVPKIVGPRHGFRDIFGESMKEFSNIKAFATFTDNNNDIDDVQRRLLRDSLKTVHDFTIHVTIKKDHSFITHYLASIFSYGTLMIFPVVYSWEYIVTADVLDSSGKLRNSYSRKASLTTWTELLLVFAYPFFPEDVKTEEIYLESLRDIFRQIESERILIK
jgi:hypothetical protein